VDGTDPMFGMISKFTNPTLDGSEESTMHSDDPKDALNHNGELDCLSDVTTRESVNTPSALDKAHAAMMRSQVREMDTIPNPFTESPAERQRLDALAAAQRLREHDAYQGAMRRYSILAFPDPSSGSSVGSEATQQKDRREVYNAYHHPTIGSTEDTWPSVQYHNDTQNNRYLTLSATSCRIIRHLHVLSFYFLDSIIY
jgi:hypothetical protein